MMPPERLQEIKRAVDEQREWPWGPFPDNAGDFCEVSGHSYNVMRTICRAAPELLAEVERMRAGWRPIETAPKDGTPILGWSDTHGREICWWEGEWHSPLRPFVEADPTHWMPLLAPPEVKS